MAFGESNERERKGMWREIGKTVRKAIEDGDMTVRFLLCVVVLTAAAVVLLLVGAAAV
ncbi:hypothetical protein [Nocardia sp. CA-120079]|uniref:hypothetical protein n=1 Tax=Nocardia sp. CA-120079 TaxID=3239974 RepID=UPI003D96E9A2